ncbi:unnamed protein product [Lactuca virosa]|uniref:F-box associated beta-propeller type 3 domain-containing protein n=1 Tax=Lactuca virosa TaxID=75947 RepID=A0AAU9P3P4_9ASTR|nr:unnamed protein product [Lactuca virosa]
MIHHNSEKETNGNYHKPGILKWVEIKDKLDRQHLQQDPVMRLDLNLSPFFQNSRVHPVGSVNGLICLWQYGLKTDNYFICNPITREYMILPNQQYYKQGYVVINHGFGVGSLTHEYKVIRIYQRDIPFNPTSTSGIREAEVYTLGMGKWRSLGHVPYTIGGFFGLFFNGHVHWSVFGKDSPEKLFAFDLDNETFKLFPSPPVETIQGSLSYGRSLAVLKGCLCQSDSFESQFTVWVMKEYGIKESWHREVIIKQSISPDLDWFMTGLVELIECLPDGTILMAYDRHKLLAYSPQRRAVTTIADEAYSDSGFSGIAYRPSFLTLRDFESQKVRSVRSYQKQPLPIYYQAIMFFSKCFYYC